MINYFAEDVRSTPLNLAVARVLLGGLMLWKLLRYDWGALRTWPAPIRDFLPVFRSGVVFAHVEVVVAACGLALLGVVFGYHLRVTAWVSALLLTYLGAVRHAFQLSHTSRILFNAALLLLLFGLFADEDEFRIGSLAALRSAVADEAWRPRTAGRSYRHRALKWALVVVGFFYFQAGVSKFLLGDPIAWVQPWNLGRYIAFRADGPTYVLADFFLEHPPLLFVGALGTVLLELGFLSAIVLGRTLWPFFVGLVGMHAVIAVTVGPVFADQLPFLAIFLPWDSAIERVRRRPG